MEVSSKGGNEKGCNVRETLQPFKLLTFKSVNMEVL
jgi:hypothetical protein